MIKPEVIVLVLALLLVVAITNTSSLSSRARSILLLLALYQPALRLTHRVGGKAISYQRSVSLDVCQSFGGLVLYQPAESLTLPSRIMPAGLGPAWPGWVNVFAG